MTMTTIKTLLPRLLLILPAVAVSVAGARADIKETPLSPTRIVWMSDTTGTDIKNADVLLQPFSGQVSVNDAAKSAVLVSHPGRKASVLLDFGKEIYGGLKIFSGMPKTQKSKRLRVCLGESVTEAMSDVNIDDNPQNPTNEHSLRDFIVSVPWLGSVECGKSGFRFARIDVLDTDEPFELRYVEARSFLRDDPEIGRFECSDQRLNDIWQTGAYTVKLNMQDYVWDGIKRDRLVWLGDMHPEVMTIASVWGEMPVVNKSLDYAVTDTPLPGWMNNMCSYSIWWLIIHRDLYLYQGNLDYLRRQQPYIRGLVAQIDSHVDKNGREQLGSKLEGQRFLDWPTSESPEIIGSGLQSMTYMAMKAAEDIAGYLGDDEMLADARACLKRMDKVKAKNLGNKQASALGIISGRVDNPAKATAVIEENGADGFSTFYGYYMLEALAMQGKKDEAMKLMSDYWGAMLDLGATTFWEDLKYSDVANAARIDEFVPSDKYDIHAGGGAYCYKGLRLSLCHGWASGPTSWLSRHVLGVRPLEPGCATIEVDPYLGNLEWVKGAFPTPHGAVEVEVTRQADGSPLCHVKAPRGVKVVNKASGDVLTYDPVR